ncbi:peptidase family C50-domain-containing protein [Lenzites betulinus]|nr:peptidase family C50-domain-containing protein [Lenzites betulinus]
MPPTTKSRAAPARTTRATSSTKSSKSPAASAVSPDELADSLASKLSISDPKGKAKPADTTPQQRKANAMRSVNAASKSLSSLAESGWRASDGKSDRTNAAAAVKHAATARKELGILRKIGPGELDVERAASSVVGKLISLEMYQAASGVLQDMRIPLVALYHSEPPPAPTHSLHDLISLPLYDGPISELHLTLISNYLLHTLTVALQTTTDLPALLVTLHDSATHSLLAWATALSHLPEKQHDHIFTRAYTVASRLAASSTSPPASAYSLRIYSLLFLAHTRPSVIAPNTFWEQATKFTAAFANMDSAKPLEGARAVLEGSARLVAHTEQRSDRADFMAGPAFARFCEYWSRFAKQAGDLRTFEQISGLTKASSGGAETDADRAVIEASALSTTLARALAIFEAWQDHTDDIVDKLREAFSAISRCSSSLGQPGEDHDRVKRGVERLRRAVMKIIEPPTSSNIDYPPSIRTCARAMLEQIVDALCEQKAIYTSTIVTGAVESLFALSRTAFVLNNPDTYATAGKYLERATALVHSASQPSHNAGSDVASSSQCTTPQVSSTSLTRQQLANYTRCIAGAYYNCALQLHQSGRLAHAVPFLEEACARADAAVREYRSAGALGDSEDGAAKREVWKQLEEQLCRRWELLAVCHAKTGDRQLAYDAFVKSIRAFPYALHDVAELAAKTPPSAFFEASAPGPLKHLAALVDRVTYMAACELFRAPETIPVSAWPEFSDALQGEHAAIVGVLMERQLTCLEECRWKEGVGAVMDAILNSAEALYASGGWAVRRARVLVRRMEIGYQREGGDASYADMKQLGDEIEASLAPERVEEGQDRPLARFAPEIRAATHLWLAAHAHKARDPALATALIAHVDDACKILRAMVPPAAPRQSVGKSPAVGKGKGKAVEPPAARRGGRTTRAAAAAGSGAEPPKSRIAVGRTRAAKTTTAVVAPVTPKRRRALDPVSLNTAATVTSPRYAALAGNVVGKMEFDDFERLVKLIRMASHLVGLVGHVLARIQLLNAARRLTERHTGVASEVYVSLTIDTAHEYVKLGRAEKAASVLAHVLPAIRGGTLSQEVAILFLLRYAEAQAAMGEVLKAAMTYCDAVATAADCVVEDKALPTAQRIRVRTALLERAAEAALAYAAIQDARDDPTSSLEGLLQALRLWNRAVDTLSRLQPPPTPKAAADDNPFEVRTKRDTDTAVSPLPEPRVLSPHAARAHAFLDAAGWRLAEGLLGTLLALAQAYAARGSAREAEFFAQQARELAQALHAPVVVARALAQQGELQIQLGQLAAGHAALMEAAALVGHLQGPDAAEIGRLRGRYSLLSADAKGAQVLFEEATRLLDELGGVFVGLEGGSSARKSVVASPRAGDTQAQLSKSESVLAPTLLARLLRHHISLLHEVGEEYANLLQRFANLPHTADAKAEETALRAKLTLDEVYSRFRADMFLSSLAESAMTIPMGMSGDVTPSMASQDMLETLATAEKLFWEHMGYIARRGHVSSVREAAICLALIRTFRTSLGSGDMQTPVLAAQLLDASTVTTLRREMLDVIRHKFLNLNAMDDTQWPRMTPNGSPLPPQPKARPRLSHHSILSDSDDDEPMDDVDLKAYWQAIAKRYDSQRFDVAKMSVNQADQLPPHWTVVNVSITEDRHTMFVTRQRAGRKPLIFCLPLKGRRDGQEDEHLTYEDAIKELQEIIHLSDEGTRQAANVKKDDRNARIAWWQARSDLDSRLQALLTDIEFCWLGAFKTIFTPADVPAEELVALRARLDTVFKGSLVFQEKKPKSRIGLDDGLLECFSTLPPNCRDEELEDLVYFVLDLYQFHGVPVAISEVDMDQVVVELRTALEEHAARVKVRAPPPGAGAADDDDNDNDSHIFLVLDKNVQGIPWESLPALRGQSVSRIPSMDFLVDRLEFSHWRKWEDGRAQDGRVDRASVDPRRTYFVLNPSGDLKGTEGRFAHWLGEMKSVGWDGVVGRAPSEQQFVDALTNRDLMIYFGHGGAEQYIRSHKIRHLPRCAATMLWGCSSGVLKYMGDFDRTGTPYHYMLAGCPTLVANLWDVTDRDIDKFSQAVFDDLRLTPDAVREWRTEESGAARTSVVRAVARARECCKLKYLTGAAPVVYGIPFYL